MNQPEIEEPMTNEIANIDIAEIKERWANTRERFDNVGAGSISFSVWALFDATLDDEEALLKENDALLDENKRLREVAEAAEDLLAWNQANLDDMADGNVHYEKFVELKRIRVALKQALAKLEGK